MAFVTAVFHHFARVLIALVFGLTFCSENIHAGEKECLRAVRRVGGSNWRYKSPAAQFVELEYHVQKFLEANEMSVTELEELVRSPVDLLNRILAQKVQLQPGARWLGRLRALLAKDLKNPGLIKRRRAKALALQETRRKAREDKLALVEKLEFSQTIELTRQIQEETILVQRFEDFGIRLAALTEWIFPDSPVNAKALAAKIRKKAWGEEGIHRCFTDEQMHLLQAKWLEVSPRGWILKTESAREVRDELRRLRDESKLAVFAKAYGYPVALLTDMLAIGSLPILQKIQDDLRADAEAKK